jgi:hypothetical protein
MGAAKATNQLDLKYEPPPLLKIFLSFLWYIKPTPHRSKIRFIFCPDRRKLFLAMARNKVTGFFSRIFSFRIASPIKLGTFAVGLIITDALIIINPQKVFLRLAPPSL